MKPALGLYAAVIAAYLAGVELTFRINTNSSFGQAFFLSAGVSLAAIYLSPPRLRGIAIAAVATAEFAQDIYHHQSVLASLGYMAADVLGPLIGAFLLWRTIGPSISLTRRRDLFAFVALAVATGPAIDALIGAATTSLRGGPAMNHVVPGWWAGDALGTLVIAGAILAWADREPWPVQPRHLVLEAAAASIATILLTWLAFWHWQPSLAYITIPMLVWIGARFGARGAGLAGIFLALAADWATIKGHGLFALALGGSQHDRLIYLQLFLAIALLTAFFAAAQVAELATAERSLFQSQEAERAAREAARAGRAADRAQLARELHDSVGHTVSVMVLQAGAARLARDTRPEQAPELISSIEETGRGSLEELDRLLSLLGTADEEVRTPLPGVGDLEELVGSVRATGLAVELSVAPGLGTLPPSLAASIYRVVQEGLTNTLKHASATRATVTIKRHDGSVFVEIADNGKQPHNQTATGEQRGGRGLAGMHERVALFGGELSHGPQPAGGWRVQARFPLEPNPTLT